MLDVFFQPAYGRLYEKEGSCELYVCEGAAGRIQSLFLKRPVPQLPEAGQYYDVITPYGYGGPVCTQGEPTPELIADFYTGWEDYCRKNRIVSEFVRFHLFDNAALRAAFPGQVLQVSDNVVRSLSLSEEALWMDTEHKVRKNVNKARASGLTVSIDTEGAALSEFLTVYYATMERNHARAFFFFDRSYFENLLRTLPGQFVFIHVRQGDTLVSTELALCSGRYVYSFLGGTLDEYYPLRPNDLLKWELIRWSKQTGHEYLILGGGYGCNDGIYRYKKAFSPNGDVPFYVGRAVHNEAVYERLVQLRRQAGEPNKDFFPLYRG